MKYRVKSKEQIVKWLENNGYKKYDNYWEHNHFVSFDTSMFDYCGSEPSVYLDWLPDWLEEVKAPDDLLEYDESEIEKGIAENRALKDAIENEEKLTHEQVFDLWFEIRGHWRKIYSYRDNLYKILLFSREGTIYVLQPTLEELQQIPHAKIPPRG